MYCNWTTELKAHNWEVDLGVILEISTDMTTNLGCRWQGRSDYSSDLQVFLIMISLHQS